MIRTTDLQRLFERGPNGKPLLSLYLDMGVNSDNKRTYGVFLNKQRSQFPELASDQRAPIGRAFERVERWLEESFEESNRGVSMFAEVGGDWFEAFQFPVRVSNRLEIGQHPVVGPLTEVLASHQRYCVGLVDREHLRLLAVFMGQVQDERTVAPDALPTAHDVHAGGVATKDFQRRKAEEVRQFFKDFAAAVADFDRQHAADAWILAGTTENVQQFRECLPPAVDGKVIHTAHVPIDGPAAEVLGRLTPVFEENELRNTAELVDLVRDRVRNQHLAVAGVGPTLEQLQEGKVDRLVIARDLESTGAQCTRCHFYLVSPSSEGACPYCGGDVENGVDLVESMIRVAAQQQLRMEFVAREPIAELAGVGALLRF
jgi:peptide chain release factor subunit 1